VVDKHARDAGVVGGVQARAGKRAGGARRGGVAGAPRDDGRDRAGVD
jgi:hypothetical protein